MSDYPMHGYIKEQPEALKNLTDIRKAATSRFVEIYEKVKPDRIYLFGSGTSLNAASLSAPFMQKILGIEVSCLAASQITETRVFGETPLFIAISQGGTSANTIKAIEMYKDYPVLVITSKPESTMAVRYPDLHVMLECGEEKAGPKTKGYTCTILTFYLYALEAGFKTGSITEDEYDEYISLIYDTCEKLTGNVEKTFAWFEREKDNMKSTNSCVVFGKDVAQRLSVESALKILETVRYPAMHYEFEEYLHGPIMVKDAGLMLLGIVPLDDDKKRALDLIKVIYNETTKCSYAITNIEDPELPNALVLDFPDNQYFAVFAQTLASQVIASELPAVMGGTGFDDDYFMKIDKVVGTKDRIPKKEEE
ncbi:MAG: SIS domain-containing protein [Firmicutes bacterium]|nr:SIS domain-containing protein [Bacillota bacterium]